MYCYPHLRDKLGDLGLSNREIERIVGETERYRIDHYYPNCSPQEWDVIQAEELFDDDGEPLFGWAGQTLPVHNMSVLIDSTGLLTVHNVTPLGVPA